MADPQALVIVEKFDVEDSFDRKHKQDSKLKTAMQGAAEKAIDRSSVLTTKGSVKPGMKELVLGGGVSKLTTWTEKNDVYIKAEMVMQLATNPGRSAFGFATGKKSIGGINPKKMDKEVQDLLTALVDDLMSKNVVKDLEKKASAT